MVYYIKNIWGPGGQEGYPHEDKTEFAERQEKAAQRFSECSGFLLYETGHCEGNKIGAKAIFAHGTVVSPEIIFDEYARKHGESIGVAERSFPYIVKINLSERINPLDGVSLDTIRKIIGRPKETMQRQGGIVKITKEQFDKLCLELDKAVKNQKNE